MTRFPRVMPRLTALCLCALLLVVLSHAVLAEGEETGLRMDPEVTFRWDGEAAFAGYAARLFGLKTHGERPPRGASVGTAVSKLSDEATAAYEILTPLIRQVAAGERASTVFDVSAAGMPTSERALLFHALTADLPYEMYWAHNSYMSASSGGKLMSLYIAVSPAYRAEGYDANDPAVDVNKTGAAVQALANAQALAEDARRLDGNFAKVEFLKNSLCAMVEYNEDALTPNYYLSDFDPWQIIYVFDDDPTTDVVCEGYAKAFQYLCDNAGLDGAVCYYADGDFSSGDGAPGGHAWNVVHMADGGNYLVDVTHCDQGDFIDDRRFLAGGTGSVTEGYVIELPETQITIGSDAYILSAETVRYTYSEETLSLWSENVLALSPTAFDPENHVCPDPTVDTEPSCTEPGTGHGYCPDCGQTVPLTLAALGHDLASYSAQAPTCTETGWTEYEACSRCDYSTYAEVPALNHELIHHEAQAPTATEPGWEAYDTCSRCDYSTYVELPALGPAALPGDLNGDGKANGKDAVLLQRYLAGGYNVALTKEQADLNGDGKANGKDAVLLQRYLAGGYNVTLT